VKGKGDALKIARLRNHPRAPNQPRVPSHPRPPLVAPHPPVETPDGWSKVANGEAAYEALDGDDVKVVVGATQVVDIGFDYNWFEETFTEVCISRGLALINMGGTSCDNSNDAGKRIALVGRFTPADGSAIVY